MRACAQKHERTLSNRKVPPRLLMRAAPVLAGRDGSYVAGRPSPKHLPPNIVCHKFIEAKVEQRFS